MSPPLLNKGEHNIFCTPQCFVIKNNVVVQILWLHYITNCQLFESQRYMFVNSTSNVLLLV